jgi:hypothetical protein
MVDCWAERTVATRVATRVEKMAVKRAEKMAVNWAGRMDGWTAD